MESSSGEICFKGGVRGSDVQVDPPPRVTTNGKRKTRSKMSLCTASKAESSRAKKSKARSGGRTRCPPPEPTSSILESVSALIRDGLREGQSDVYATVCVEMKAMKLRLERCLKENVCAAVSAALSARVVDNVLGDLAYGYEQHRSQPSPSLHPTHNHPNANKTAVHAQSLVDGTSNGDGVGEELTVPPANVSRSEVILFHLSVSWSVWVYSFFSFVRVIHQLVLLKLAAGLVFLMKIRVVRWILLEMLLCRVALSMGLHPCLRSSRSLWSLLPRQCKGF